MQRLNRLMLTTVMMGGIISVCLQAHSKQPGCDPYLLSVLGLNLRAATWIAHPLQDHVFEKVWHQGRVALREKLTGVILYPEEVTGHPLRLAVELPYLLPGIETKSWIVIPSELASRRILWEKVVHYFDLGSRYRLSAYSRAHSVLNGAFNEMSFWLLLPVRDHLLETTKIFLDSAHPLLVGTPQFRIGFASDFAPNQLNVFTGFRLEGEFTEPHWIYTANMKTPGGKPFHTKQIRVFGAIGIQVEFLGGYYQYNFSFPEQDIYLSGRRSYTTWIRPSGSIPMSPPAAVIHDLFDHISQAELIEHISTDPAHED